MKFSFCGHTIFKLKKSPLWNEEQEMIFEALVYMTHRTNCHHDSCSNMAKIRYYFLETIIVNRNWNKTTEVAFLSEVQNLFVWKFFAACVIVASLFSMLFKCVSSWQEGVSLWLVICHHDSQKIVFPFHSCSRVRVKQCAWNLHQSCLTSRSINFKKNQPKPIIRTGVTVPNVQKCVMVATLTLCDSPHQ